MVKQTKTFKKGNVTKKALSAILAASMVMTSSSFVMAAPVEVEDVAVEAAAVAEDAAVVDVVEDVDAGEESVGAELTASAAEVEIAKTGVTTYNGQPQTPEVTVKYTPQNEAECTQLGLDNSQINTAQTLTEGKDYTLEWNNNTNANADSAGNYLTDVKKATVKVVFDQKYSSLAAKTAELKIKQVDLANAVWELEDEGLVYNGKEQVPGVVSATVEVTDNSGRKVDLDIPNDAYELVANSSSGNLIDAGEKSAKIKAKDEKGNFSGESTAKTYTISKAHIDSSKVQVKANPLKYTNTLTDTELAAVITVTDINKKEELVKDTDYSLEYKKDGNWILSGADLNVGTHEFRIKTLEDSTNYYKDEYVKGTYEIVANDTLNMCTLEIDGFELNPATGAYEQTYNGTDLFPGAGKTAEVTLTLPSGDDLTEKDFEVETVKAEWKDAGDYAVVVKGLNTYIGQTLTIPVKITPKALNTSADAMNSSGKIDVKANYGKTNSGATSSVVVSITDNGKDLELDKDYTYTTQTVGTGENAEIYVIITGKGNYTTEGGSGKTTYTTLKVKAVKDANGKMSLQDSTISAVVNGEYTYKKPFQLSMSNIVVKENDPANPNTLTSDDFYIDHYEVVGDTTAKTAIDKASEWYVVIAAKTDSKRYTGKRKIKFTVDGTSFADTFAIEAGSVKDYTKDQMKNSSFKENVAEDLRVVWKSNGAEYANTNYTLKYYDKNAKEITGAITEIGTYTVEVIPTVGKYAGKLTATFNVLGESIKDVTVDEIKDQNWTGSAIEPAVKVTKAGKPLVAGKDYKVTYQNNVKVGTAYVTIEGIGEYSGKIARTFNIVGEMDQTIEVLAAQERDLGNGSRTLNSKATKIKYTTAPETAVTYTSSDENVVTVDAEGNLKYTGLGEATITIEAKAENGYKAAKKEIKVVVKLAKPSFTPFSKNNAFTLTSSTVKGAEKFEVQYATKKNFSNAKTKTFTTTTAGKIRQVKVAAADKRTYYVRVRAVSGTTKSAWSGVKTVATK